jgi:ABC-type nitrate/sulfonate/bicarbonate transport system ATPase subunit
MRQRLALLRTVLSPSRTMLLDEPFGALDAITRREMHTWLQEVLGAVASEEASGLSGRRRPGPSDARQEAGPRTVLFITHDVEEALVLSDAVYVMSPRPGRMVAKVEVAFDRPRPSEIVVEAEFVRLKAELLRALAKG